MRALARTVASALLVSLGLGAASAQTAPDQYPQRAVKLILPFGPGSGSDIAARLIADKLQTKWGKAVIVEPRPGGDGLIAINAFLSAKDDHTLLFASTASFIVHPYTLQSKPPYDSQRDLVPIARAVDSGLAVAISTGSGANSLAEFVALARKNPGKLNVAGGAGLAELTVRAFVKEQNLDVSIVPYKDIIQAGSDLAENRIQLVSASLSMPMPHVQAGKVKLAAIAAPRRTPLAPDVPSAPEAGFPTLGYESTIGFYGPEGMGLDLRRRIAADVMEALNDPAVAKRLFNAGMAVNPQGPEELAEIVRQQRAATARLADILGIKAKD
ncbi:MAG: tripartite tricarboxylate transporter substrate binding protein [Beijerinckiaceae bacterium]|nr:tripartite tricarboxylate transporter substrate binding protein [Beijerinckiaceae bacterium]